MFTKGESGNPNGRPPGSKNKITEATEARRDDLYMGIDPIAALIRVGAKAEKDGELAVAASCYKDLCGYLYPKLRSIEVAVGNKDDKVFEVLMTGYEGGD